MAPWIKVGISVSYLALSCSFFDKKSEKHSSRSADAPAGLDAPEEKKLSRKNESATGEVFDPATSLELSKRTTLNWKRAQALVRELAQSLSLPIDNICQELGSRDCVQDVFLSDLGGNNPFDDAIYVAPKKPLATTPLAIDRLILSACSTRADLDQKSGPTAAVTFIGLDMKSKVPVDESLQKLIRHLYRQILARDPTAPEVAVLQEEAGTAEDGREFAVTSCAAIASSIENLFI